MELKEYSELAIRTADLNNSPIIHGVMGINGEAGEIIDLVKKSVFYGRELDGKLLIEEIGDMLWYTNLLIHAAGSTWGEVMAANIAKLEARYPDLRFDADRANNRDTDAEQAAINRVL